MNHMKEVAEMLGVHLGEEFKVKDEDRADYRYKFTEEKLEGMRSEYVVFEASHTLIGLLNGEFEVVKLPILNEKEKKYLSDFIDPFKSQVTYIEKRYLKDFKGNEKEFISIGIKENEKYWRQMELPLYDAGKYYKGMNTSEHYTLEELGL